MKCQCLNNSEESQLLLQFLLDLYIHTKKSLFPICSLIYDCKQQDFTKLFQTKENRSWKRRGAFQYTCTRGQRGKRNTVAGYMPPKSKSSCMYRHFVPFGQLDKLPVIMKSYFQHRSSVQTADWLAFGAVTKPHHSFLLSLCILLMQNFRDWTWNFWIPGTYHTTESQSLPLSRFSYPISSALRSLKAVYN